MHSTVVYNTIVKKCFVPGKLTWHSLVCRLYEAGMLKVDVKLLRNMTTEGVLADKSTFNMLILKCTEKREMRKAINLLGTMNFLGVLPDGDAYDSIVKGLTVTFGFIYSYVLARDVGKWFYSY